MQTQPPERDDVSKGCCSESTVVHAKPTDRVSQEEVFGPVVTVTTFRDDTEAKSVWIYFDAKIPPDCPR